MTVKLRDDLAKRLRAEAERTGKSTDELVREILSRGLDELGRYLDAVDEGFASGEREGWLEWDDVDAELGERTAKVRAEHRH